MTTKFPKSNISISGTIDVNIFGVGSYDHKFIRLKGLNQSKSGVYCLRNKLNGRLYIGQTRNLENRKSRHGKEIRNETHHAYELVRDFISFTETTYDNQFADVWDIFEFEVIIYCYPSELTFWEKILIDNLHPYYNVKKKKEL